MENATHTFCGLALARLGFDRLGPRATTALVIASNLPDADAIGALWGGQPWYLCHHRGLTHALSGLFVQGLLLGFLVWAPRRSPDSPRLLSLIVVSWVGLLFHLGMDGLNNYGIRPWLPFDSSWVYGDLVFIVDPWLWLTIGGAACLGSPARGRPWGWIVFYVVAAFLMWTSDRSPAPAAGLWTVLMAAVIWHRWRRPAAPRRRTWAWGGALATLLYLGALTTLQNATETRGISRAERELAAGEQIEETSMAPRPAVPWAYRLLVATRQRIYRWDVDLLRDTVQPGPVLQRGLEDPWIERARGTAEFDAWRCFARHPFAARFEGDLILGDGRYSSVPEPGWSNLRVHLPPPR